MVGIYYIRWSREKGPLFSSPLFKDHPRYRLAICCDSKLWSPRIFNYNFIKMHAILAEMRTDKGFRISKNFATWCMYRIFCIFFLVFHWVIAEKKGLLNF